MQRMVQNSTRSSEKFSPPPWLAPLISRLSVSICSQGVSGVSYQVDHTVSLLSFQAAFPRFRLFLHDTSYDTLYQFRHARCVSKEFLEELPSGIATASSNINTGSSRSRRGAAVTQNADGFLPAVISAACLVHEVGFAPSRLVRKPRHILYG